MDYEMLKLDNQLCFALYACSREITKLYKPHLESLGLTYTQYITLLVLWEQDNIKIKQLGKILHLDSGTLTPLLNKLEKADIVTRIKDNNDERNVFVKLTVKGTEMKDKAKEIPAKVFCSKELSIDQAIDLREELKALLTRLDNKADI